MSGNCDVTVRWIPDAWSVILTFSIIATFYLTKTENRTKKSLTQLSYYIALSKGTIFETHFLTSSRRE